MHPQANRPAKKHSLKPTDGWAKIGATAIGAVAAIAILAVGIKTSLHAQLAPTSSSWPIYHHDLGHTGLSPFNTANNPGSLKWKFATGNFVESSPTIGSDGTIYFGSDDGNVYAVDPYGNLKWNFTTQDSSIVRTAPTIGADGTIYFGAEGGRSYGGIYALNPDGSEKWFSLVEFDVDSSPAIGSDGSIYFGDAGAAIVKLNSSGTMQWRYIASSYVVSSPALGSDANGNTIIYIGCDDGNLYALSSSGTLLWKFAASAGGVVSSPAIGSDGTIYVGSVQLTATSTR